MRGALNGDIDHFLLCREWRVLRMRALERDGAKCSCCGKTARDGVVLNVDHIKPRLRYPELALTLDNLQVLCDACNHGKGNTYETDWRSARPSRPSLLDVARTSLPSFDPSAPRATAEEEGRRLAQLSYVRQRAQEDAGSD